MNFPCFVLSQFSQTRTVKTEDESSDNRLHPTALDATFNRDQIFIEAFYLVNLISFFIDPCVRYISQSVHFHDFSGEFV